MLMLKCRMSFLFIFSIKSKDNWILWKCPSLNKKQSVENSQDKKGRVALSHLSNFAHVDPYIHMSIYAQIIQSILALCI